MVFVKKILLGGKKIIIVDRSIFENLNIVTFELLVLQKTNQKKK